MEQSRAQSGQSGWQEPRLYAASDGDIISAEYGLLLRDWRWDIIVQVIPRRHYAAHLLKKMIDSGFDPKDPAQYLAKMRERKTLPGMPNEAEWERAKFSIGELHTRSVLAMEILALAFEGLHQRVDALEKKGHDDVAAPRWEPLLAR